MDSSKALLEQIDALAIEARAIMETARTESREPNDIESARFDQITDTLIPDLKARAATAKNREEKILELSVQAKRQTKMEELADLLNQPASEPRVLPTNGRFEQADEPQRVYVRAGRLKAFKNERDAFNAGMWFRAIVSRLFTGSDDVKAIQHCHRVGLEIGNTSAEGTGAGGGYLVPAPIASTIIEVRERVGIARQVCEITPMTSNTFTYPKRSGGLTVYYPDEAATITDSTKNWAQIELIARKRGVASKISQELVDDALISIVDNVVTEMSYALALNEDDELINGTGSSAYGTVRGLLSKIGSAGVSTAAVSSTWAALTLGEVMTAMGLLPDRFNRNPSIICSSNFYWTVLARLQASGGGNAIAELQAGPSQRTFLGMPVYTTSKMPTATAAATKCMLFGQFDMAAVLGDRTGIRIGRDDSTVFLSDVTTLKATARYDIVVHEPGDSSNPGAYVALSTHS